MGLCKCPKRKVTNLFCFEHRVNVCEHCMVANHPKCIVKSYLQWLQDSDYSTKCTLCSKDLAEGDVVRLLCYDVFHWECLDAYARKFPPNTAPAGYTCPTCNASIFPSSNMISPVAETLRKYLSKVNWARAGLGLSPIEEPKRDIPAHSSLSSTLINVAESSQASSPTAVAVVSPQQAVPTPVSRGSYGQTTRPQPRQTAALGVGSSGLSGDNMGTHARTDKQFPSTSGGEHRVYDARKDDLVVDIVQDHDKDKYKRRSAFHWFARWFKSRAGSRKSVESNVQIKRMAILLLIALLAFFTFVIVMTSVGRASANSDPLLDPLNNPNIRIGRRI
ncbi:zinc finger protein-like 1 homolog [Diadema antillarum]|uniref:zinc finger protein-like 1 homolog n=1 Tax=Diadema antillarum TaxID=105358 RepID=UPI003A8A4598